VTTTEPADLTRTADRLRAEAELTDLIGNVLFDAVSLPVAAISLAGVANAKRAAAEELDLMAAERLQNSSEGQSA
jgi:hypothetical protein